MPIQFCKIPRGDTSQSSIKEKPPLSGAEDQVLARQLRLASVNRLIEMPRYRHMNLTKAKMRAWIFRAEDHYSASGKRIPGNGLASAIRRRGRSVYVVIELFDQWLLNDPSCEISGTTGEDTSKLSTKGGYKDGYTKNANAKNEDTTDENESG
jgi:hypothetical protein